MNSLGYIPCTTCGRVGTTERTCERCGAQVHARKPKSLQRAWAWLLAGITFYIPANILPILVTEA
ncbi:MAG: paraquat-inducible membrane protein A, partial [Myxococcota bacterium]